MARREKTYWRIGGSPSTEAKVIKRDRPKYRKLAAKLYREQVKDFRSMWGDAPNRQARKTFLTIAKIDASTMIHNRHIDRLEARARKRTETRGSR